MQRRLPPALFTRYVTSVTLCKSTRPICRAVDVKNNKKPSNYTFFQLKGSYRFVFAVVIKILVKVETVEDFVSRLIAFFFFYEISDLELYENVNFEFLNFE